MANLRKLVYLTEAQKDELFSLGTVTSNNVTITYDENDLYVTPDKSVESILLNGTTYTPTNGAVNLGHVLTSANNSIIAPVETSSTASLLYNLGDYFIYNDLLYKATSTIATSTTITPNTNCTVVLVVDLITGIIDDTAGNGTTNKVWSADKVYDQLALKASTSQVNSLIAPIENTSTTSNYYNKGDIFIYNNTLYKTFTSIDSGSTIIPGTNCIDVNISSFLKEFYVPINGGSPGTGLKYYIGLGETDEDPIVIGVISSSGAMGTNPHIIIGPSSMSIVGLHTPSSDNDAANKYYVDTAISNVVPPAPTTDGTYYLTCTVSSGTPTYSWTSIPLANGVSF